MCSIAVPRSIGLGSPATAWAAHSMSAAMMLLVRQEQASAGAHATRTSVAARPQTTRRSAARTTRSDLPSWGSAFSASREASEWLLRPAKTSVAAGGAVLPAPPRAGGDIAYSTGKRRDAPTTCGIQRSQRYRWAPHDGKSLASETSAPLGPTSQSLNERADKLRQPWFIVGADALTLGRQAALPPQSEASR